MLRTILGIQPRSARIGGEAVLRSVDLLTLSAQEREQVRGSWTVKRVRACLPRLLRFLLSSPRKRRQQEAEVRQWLEERLYSAPPLEEAA